MAGVAGSPTTFAGLQAGLYNALLQGLPGSSASSFQLVQPSPPLLGGTDADRSLWQFFDNLPPYSLSANLILSGGNQFLANYSAVTSALRGQPNEFAQVVGEECATAFYNVLKNAGVPATGNQPLQFRNWALASSTYAKVAVSGATALQKALLDPVFAAQVRVLPYQPVGTLPADFVPGYASMMMQLMAAPGSSFTVPVDGWRTNVAGSWTGGQSQATFGLWGGSSSSSPASQKFAAGGVCAQVSFDNVLRFAAAPGGWFNGKAFGLAFAHPDVPPWVAGSQITWASTFGPQGNMQRFLSELFVVNGMRITIQSLATWDAEEQLLIQQNRSNGLWPVYYGGDGSAPTVSFDGGQMAFETASDTGVAIVIGCSVLTAAQYVGAPASDVSTAVPIDAAG